MPQSLSPIVSQVFLVEPDQWLTHELSVHGGLTRRLSCKNGSEQSQNPKADAPKSSITPVIAAGVPL
jgi:hypothetical protein